MIDVQIPLKLLIRNLVVRLVLVVIWKFLLDGVISEVYFWFKVVDVELVGGGSDVALFVPVGSCDAVEVGDEHVVADVELSVVVEHGSVDVHLHDIGVLCLLFVWRLVVEGGLLDLLGLLEDAVQLIDLVYDGYASTLVAVLPRLNYPNIPSLPPPLLSQFLLLLLNHLGSLLIIIQKLKVFRILHGLLDMKSQRYILIDILSHQTVVLP